MSIRFYSTQYIYIVKVNLSRWFETYKKNYFIFGNHIICDDFWQIKRKVIHVLHFHKYMIYIYELDSYRIQILVVKKIEKHFLYRFMVEKSETYYWIEHCEECKCISCFVIFDLCVVYIYFSEVEYCAQPRRGVELNWDWVRF